MKKLIVIAVLLFASSVSAAPFLVSDPVPASDDVTKFQVIMDGGAAVDSVPVALAVRYDLAGISAGSHSVTVRACNIWSCSADSVPLVFNKVIPGVPGGLRIAP
jgi:hypothetical protein